MTREEAKKITMEALSKQDEDNAKRLDKLLSIILDTIKKAAKEGRSSILFAHQGLKYNAEEDMIKSKLENLGYYFMDESEQGMKYEMICW